MVNLTEQMVETESQEIITYNNLNARTDTH